MELTKAFLQGLITNRIEESANLDYKAAESIGRSDGRKKEITKDISSFANGGGGRIIYGIKEHTAPELKHLPEKLDPINQAEFTKEWLDQIAGQIQPRIDGLRITPVHVGPGISDYCYVVDIPQSGTAHQALDHRYYKRSNFESVPMVDYEIRDISNRRKHPKLEVEVRVICRGRFREGSHIAVRVANISRVLARHYLVRIEMPVKLPNGLVVPEEPHRMVTEGGLASWVIGLSATTGIPLFPESSIMLHRNFKYASAIEPDPGPSGDNIRIHVFADEMEKLELTKSLQGALLDWV